MTEYYSLTRRTVLKSAAAVGAVSVFGFPVFAGSALAVTPGEKLYGTQQETGDIYEVDVAAGTATLFFDASSASVTPSYPKTASSPNGNAYDTANERFYFASFGGSRSDLYFVDLSAVTPTVVHAGQLAGSSASGTIYGGAYWYVKNGSDDLQQVMLKADGTIDSESKAADIYGGRGMNFGDIAFDTDGLLYFSADVGGVNVQGTYDIGAATRTNWSGTGWPGKLQIAFAGDDALYGHDTRTGKNYAIDTSDGSLTELFALPFGGEATLTFTDLAGNRVVDRCADCEFDGTVKFEYDEDADAFVPELEDGETFTVLTYESYVNKDGEYYEPVSVTFTTEVCADQLVATVKAGRNVYEVPVTAGEDGTVVVSIADDDRFTNRHGRVQAISYVAFDCAEEGATPE